jgi:hypothetical protein
VIGGESHAAFVCSDPFFAQLALQMLDRTDEDALGVQYKGIIGKEVMIYDERTDEWVSGSFTGTEQSLYQRVVNAKGGNSGPISCSAPADSIKQSASHVQCSFCFSFSSYITFATFHEDKAVSSSICKPTLNDSVPIAGV